MEFTTLAVIDELKAKILQLSNDGVTEQKWIDETQSALTIEESKRIISNDAYAICEAIRSLNLG